MRSSLSLAALAVVLCAAAPLGAQTSAEPRIPLGVDTTSVTSVTSVTSNSIAPAPAQNQATVASANAAPLTGLRAAAHKTESRSPLQPTMMATHGNLGQARAMMVVGVAGLIAGAIIGGTPGTIIMVGGTVVGLIGLYEYLQ